MKVYPLLRSYFDVFEMRPGTSLLGDRRERVLVIDVARRLRRYNASTDTKASRRVHGLP